MRKWGEVREQVHVIIETVRRHLRRGFVIGAMPFTLHTVTLRITARRVVSEPKNGTNPRVHRALRYLIARIPLAVIGVGGQTETIHVIIVIR